MFWKGNRGRFASAAAVGGMLLLLGLPVAAVIMGGSSFQVDFTKAKLGSSKATWSDDLELAPEGLKLKTPASRQDDTWVVTEPEGEGLSWRPLQGTTVRLVVEGVPTPKLDEDGGTSIPNSGRAFVRFGPDCKHWSSWQALTLEMKPHKEKGALFTGYVGVTSTDRAAYHKYLSEYFQLDVPWTSDEEATVKWILEKDPKFFEKHLPFVGWLQFRYEPASSGEVLVQRIDVSTSWAVGGIHAVPRDEDVEKSHQGRWRFKAP